MYTGNLGRNNTFSTKGKHHLSNDEQFKCSHNDDIDVHLSKREGNEINENSMKASNARVTRVFNTKIIKKNAPPGDPAKEHTMKKSSLKRKASIILPWVL